MLKDGQSSSVQEPVQAASPAAAPPLAASYQGDEPEGLGFRGWRGGDIPLHAADGGQHVRLDSQQVWWGWGVKLWKFKRLLLFLPLLVFLLPLLLLLLLFLLLRLFLLLLLLPLFLLLLFLLLFLLSSLKTFVPDVM